MKKMFKRFFGEKIETKSSGFIESQIRSGGGGVDLSAESTIRLNLKDTISFYKNVQPVATSVDMIADEVGKIPIQVQDIVTKEFVSHDIQTLIAMPSEMKTSTDLMAQLASFYSITGNAMLIAFGDVNRPPTELMVIPPQYTSVTGGDNCSIERINVTISGCEAMNFVRHETDEGVRFFENTPNPTKEFFLIKGFNPDADGSTNLLGTSRLQPIIFMIKQFFSSGKYNLSLLKNGAQFSGIVTFLEDIDIEGRRDAETAFNQRHSGDGNAGKVLFLTGSETKFESTQQTNNDMQFEQLVKSSERGIYNQLRIPLALVMGEQMTFNNSATAKLSLFDNAVSPVADKILEGLTQFLFRRYPNSENLRLTYNEADIPALQIRRMEALKLKKELGVFSHNEIRAGAGVAGFNGGDDIYIPSNLITVGEFKPEDDVENR